MSVAYLYVGAVAPEAFALTVTPGDSGVDLSTVTAATFYLLKPSGTETTWSTTLSARSASSVTLTHTLASGTSEVDAEGDWKVYALMTLTGGFVRTTTTTLRVLGEYGSP